MAAKRDSSGNLLQLTGKGLKGNVPQPRTQHPNSNNGNISANSRDNQPRQTPPKQVKTEPTGSGNPNNSGSGHNRAPNSRGSDTKFSAKNNSQSTNPTTAATEDKRKKFTGRCRLYLGNIPPSFTEQQFKNLLAPYGDAEDMYISDKKSFGFVKLETRAAAEACKNGLDGKEVQGRVLRVRFATHSAALQVKNLSPHCTNELLERAFQQFGAVERAVVIVDDRGRSTGVGLVEFTRRNFYLKALESINSSVFYVTKSLKPISVEPLEQKDDEDGLQEKYAFKTPEYHEEVSVGPRFAEVGSMEYQIGMKWKELEKVETEKKKVLEEEMAAKRMELELDIQEIIAEHRANSIRQDLLKRQAELQALESQRQKLQDQKRREFEMRMGGPKNPMHGSRGPGASGGPMGGQGFPQSSPAGGRGDMNMQGGMMRDFPMKQMPQQQHQQHQRPIDRPLIPPPNPPMGNQNLHDRFQGGGHQGMMNSPAGGNMGGPRTPFNNDRNVPPQQRYGHQGGFNQQRQQRHHQMGFNNNNMF